MSHPRKIKAFTLIEILVALTIIGVLLTFVAPYVFDRPDQARKLKVQNDFLAISTALNLYKLDNGSYPKVQNGLNDLIAGSDQGTGYLPKIPTDPWGTSYALKALPDTGNFVILSAGPDGKFTSGSESDDLRSDVIK